MSFGIKDPTLVVWVAGAINFSTYSALTILNKIIFSTYSFRFPLFCTSFEMLATALICFIAMEVFHLSERVPVTRALWLRRTLPLSISRSIDIAAGNSALVYISVAYQQILKSLIPIFVCAFTALFPPNQIEPLPVWLSLIPVVGGTVLASFGELNFAWLGLVLQTVSCIGRGFKCVINAALLHAAVQEERMDEYNVLLLEAPLSGCIIFVVACLIEGPRLYSTVMEHMHTPGGTVNVQAVVLLTLLCGGSMFLVQLSYMALIKATSAITTQVIMNFKMIFLIVAGLAVFNTWHTVSALNFVGMLITVGGGFLYNHVCATIQKQRLQRKQLSV